MEFFYSQRVHGIKGVGHHQGCGYNGDHLIQKVGAVFGQALSTGDWGLRSPEG